MDLDEEGALFDSCDFAKPVAPTLPSKVPPPAATNQEDDVDQQDVAMTLLNPSQPVTPLGPRHLVPPITTLTVTVSTTHRRPSPTASPPLSPVGSPARSPVLSCVDSPHPSSASPVTARRLRRLSSSRRLPSSRLSSASPAPTRRLRRKSSSPGLSPTPTVSRPRNSRAEPSPAPSHDSSSTSVRKTRKRVNAGPPAEEPKSKKSRGSQSSRSHASATPAVTATASTSGSRPSSPPAWFSKALQMLKFPGVTFGEKWIDLVQVWSEFERKENFEHKENLGAKNRPDCVGQWKKRARSSTWRPDISSVSDLDREFRVWWVSLQPKWRVLDGAIVSEDVDGDWDDLRLPGPNGIVCVLVGLLYWGRIAQKNDKDRKEWEEQVEDALFALRQLVG
jgi:hypothetical protein